VEKVVGTLTFNPDTDGDGVSDGAELDAGTNPLDGLPAATGILASADTPGNAVDVCAVNEVAIVANSGGGITVFSVTAGQSPTAVAQVATPGSAQAVSCTGNLIAVADGNAGLSIIDVTDPPTSRIARQVFATVLGSGSVQAVAVAADLALVGSTGGVVSTVDLSSGVVLSSVNLGGPVQDLTIEGETLFAYANGKLQTLSFLRGPLTLLGAADSPGGAVRLGRGRIFVGGDVAYLSKDLGYNTFDVSDPANPVLMASGVSNQNIWKQIVTNGSGTGVAMVGPGPVDAANDNVSLYDTTDPTATAIDNNFLTQFPTPGIARAVTLFDGQAFVADDTAGLQVVNYLAFDTGGTPPNVPPGATGLAALIDATSVTAGDVSEGKRIVIQARVEDDVQIRNVEFFFNGTRIVADGTFPYETAFRIPLGMVGSTASFSAVARDTGGNVLNLSPIGFLILVDSEPPTVQIDTPISGQVFARPDSIPIAVSAFDNVEVASIGFQIDGIDIEPRQVSLSQWQIETRLALGAHELVAIATDTAQLTTLSAPVQFLVKDDAISREFSVILRDPHRDAVSREFSVIVREPFPDAVSREFSVIVREPFPDAVSREFSVIVRSPGRDAVSREFTVNVAQ